MPLVAFFGATGDCAGYCLASALDAGYDCRALARTPSKLTASMKAKGVSADSLDNHLTIIEGNVKDVEAVKRTLQLPGDSAVVDKIVSGVGGTPQLQWSLLQPVTLDDPTICQSAGRTILKALQELRPAKKPILANVSTTGIPAPGAPRDVPLLLVPLYHWALQVPHADKRVLEQVLREHLELPESEQALSGYVNVKPSLLMDGDGVGVQAVREGIDEKPAVGYTIQRIDVGRWMFEKLVKKDVTDQWRNKSVTITY